MAEELTKEKPKEESKMTKKFSPINEKGELDIKKLIIYGVLLVLGGGTGGGMFVGSLKPDIERQHAEAMEVLKDIRDENRQVNENLRALGKAMEVHEAQAEKREARIMDKLKEIHSDIKKK
ncbi:MAG: hypothetical protein KDD43_00875 [Bdellovibrionales bacterium]|nr:hypothetical protein [Bdellovibrionales bacterium]